MAMGDWVSRALTAVETASQQQGNLSGNGVDSLRAAIMRDGRVDASEAVRLLSLHRSSAPVVSEPGWADLFVEALADHFALSREVPAWSEEDLRPNWAAAIGRAADALAFGKLTDVAQSASWRASIDALAVGEDEAAMLVEALSADGMVLDSTEIRLLSRLFSRAVSYPLSFRSFAMTALAATVARDKVINEEEVALVRAIVMGPASCEGLAVSRAEADTIIAINSACDRDARAAGWPRLFAQAISLHVLHGVGSPGVVDAEEAQWLARNVPSASPEAAALDELLKAS